MVEGEEGNSEDQEGEKKVEKMVVEWVGFSDPQR